MDDKEFDEWYEMERELIKLSMSACRTEEERLEMVSVITKNAFLCGGLATAKSILNKI